MTKIKLATAVALGSIATSAYAVDPCLVGMWEPDYLQFGEQMMDVMDAEEVSITGEALMTIFDTGDGQYDIAGLTIGTKVEGVPPTDVTLVGRGEFSVVAEGEDFFFTMGDFAYTATASVKMPGMEAMVMEIPVTDEMAPIGAAAGLYTCTDTELLFEPIRGDDGTVGTIIQKWFRL